jgi:hypothetical protein
VDSWSGDPNSFEVGTPLRQTLIVRSDASIGSNIPPLDYVIPTSHFRNYPEQPAIDDSQGPLGINGTRTQTYSLMPTQDGSVTLPGVSVTWWDTVNEAVRISKLPPRFLSIARAASTTGTKTLPTTPVPAGEVKTAAGANVAPQTEETPAAESLADSEPFPTPSSDFWPVFGAFAALSALAALSFWLLRLWRPWLTDNLLPLRRQRSRLQTEIEHADAQAIVTELNTTIELYAHKGRDLDQAIAQSIRTTLSASLYAASQQPLDRTRLSELAAELFATGAKSRLRHFVRRPALPELYSQRA